MWELLTDLGKDALKAALTKEGFAKPQVDYQEDEDSMTLVISGTDITGSGSVDDEFQGRFWRGKLRATAYGGTFGHDAVTTVLTARHQVVRDRPHVGDASEGSLQEVASVSISAAGDAGTRKDRK